MSLVEQKISCKKCHAMTSPHRESHCIERNAKDTLKGKAVWEIQGIIKRMGRQFRTSQHRNIRWDHNSVWLAQNYFNLYFEKNLIQFIQQRQPAQLGPIILSHIYPHLFISIQIIYACLHLIFTNIISYRFISYHDSIYLIGTTSSKPWQPNGFCNDQSPSSKEANPSDRPMTSSCTKCILSMSFPYELQVWNINEK